MTGQGPGREDWAARLRASLAGGAPPAPARREEPAPEIADGEPAGPSPTPADPPQGGRLLGALDGPNPGEPAPGPATTSLWGDGGARTPSVRGGNLLGVLGAAGTESRPEPAIAPSGPPPAGLLGALATPPTGLLRPEGLPSPAFRPSGALQPPELNPAGAGGGLAEAPVAPLRPNPPAPSPAAVALRPSLAEILSAPGAERILGALSLPPVGRPAPRPAPVRAPAPRQPETPSAGPQPQPPVTALSAGPGLAPAPLAGWEPAFETEDMTALDSLAAPSQAEPGWLVDWFGLRTPGALVPELRARHGTVLRKPIPTDPRAAGADWAGVVRSVTTASGGWRGFALGAGRGDLLLSGGLAARRRGLSIRLHATEGNPGRFSALQRHAEANAIGPEERDFQQVEPAAPDRLLAMLAGGQRWDWVRIGLRDAVGPIVTDSLAALGARVRVLAVVTHGRVQEAALADAFAAAGWRLLSESASGLARADPRQVARPGVQVWLSPQR